MNVKNVRMKVENVKFNFTGESDSEIVVNSETLKSAVSEVLRDVLKQHNFENISKLVFDNKNLEEMGRKRIKSVVGRVLANEIREEVEYQIDSLSDTKLKKWAVENIKRCYRCKNFEKMVR